MTYYDWWPLGSIYIEVCSVVEVITDGMGSMAILLSHWWVVYKTQTSGTKHHLPHPIHTCVYRCVQV